MSIEDGERRKISVALAGLRQAAYAHGGAQHHLGEMGATEVALAQYEASLPEWRMAQANATQAASRLAARLGQLEALLAENGLLI